MMIHQKRYALVNAKARGANNLKKYGPIIRRMAKATFGDALVSVEVSRSDFVLRITHPTDKIPHGKLVNLGKRIAHHLNGLCQRSMRIYQSKTHPVSKQLFRCCETVLHDDE